MRYLDLIADRPLIWTLFLFYMVLTAWLAWLGHKKTGDMKSFAIGGGDMSALVVGITLASSMASTATFVINPGFVHAHGLSALLHLGLAVTLGIVAGLVSMSVGFHRIGARTGALTLPHWIGERYRSRALAVFFALVCMLYLAFIVLIVGGLSIVCQHTLGLTNLESLTLIIVFVFGYVFIGGAYAHAYTNTLQGIIMAVVAGVLVWSGLHFFADGFGAVGDGLAAIDPALLGQTNPGGGLYDSVFSVYISGFVIGFAIVCQPHIMTKALFVRDRRTVTRYLAVAIAIGVLYSAVLLVGLYARLSDLPAEAVARQDGVAMAYVSHTFSPSMVSLILVALLAAGMSTLDGILVALSTIVANDLFMPLAGQRWLAGADEARRSRAAHRASQLVLIVLGAAAFVLALDPPQLLGIFGQVGVYGLVAASTAPILFGVLLPQVSARTAFVAAVTGLGLHFGLYLGGVAANPAVPAAIAILSSCGVMLAAALVQARVLGVGGRATAELASAEDVPGTSA